MSASRGFQALLCGTLLCAQAALAAEEGEAPPDEAFLEYLGLWEESDEEWLLYEEMLAAQPEENTDPEAEGPAPTEKDDES